MNPFHIEPEIVEEDYMHISQGGIDIRIFHCIVTKGDTERRGPFVQFQLGNMGSYGDITFATKRQDLKRMGELFLKAAESFPEEIKPFCEVASNFKLEE